MKNYLVCEFCNKEFNTHQSRNAHYRYCTNRLITLGVYEEKCIFEKELHQKLASIAKLNAAKNKLKLAEERNKKLIDDNLNFKQLHLRCEYCSKIMTEKYGSGRFCSRGCANTRKHSEATKRKISNTLLNHSTERTNENVKNNNFKSGYYKGIWCDSSWELAYLICCMLDNIHIIRNKTYFYYTSPNDNKKHKYYPDFYHPENNTYVEIKGSNQYYDKDLIAAKNECMKLNNINFIYLMDDDVIPYINRVKHQYNIHNIESLYDNSITTPKVNNKHLARTKNKIWVYNDVIKKQTLIDRSILCDYLNNGWKMGRPAKSSFKINK